MQYSTLRKILIWRLKNISSRNLTLILSVIIGFLSGLIALFLKTSVFYIHKFLNENNFEFTFSNYFLLIYPSIGILLTVLMKKFVIKSKVKHNIGSILHAISRRNSFIEGHKIFSSALGGILTAGFGGSIGLESPIISSGSAIGSRIAKILHLNYKTVTLLLACGASGAMAAIFNTPVTAVIFAFEVLLIDLSQFSLIPLLMASISGAMVTKTFYIEEILFDFKIIDKFVSEEIPFFILFAIISGLIASYFTFTYLFIEKKFLKIKGTHKHIFIGALIIGLMIFLFPPFYGEGFRTIKYILSGNYEDIINGTPYFLFKDNFFVVIIFFSLLVFLKVVATIITVASGGIGGIFAPSLFSGAISGFLFAFTINNIFEFLGINIHLSEMNFAMVGMASMLGGVLHAPLTGVFLIVEITGGYELMLPLMLTTTLAFLTTKYFTENSIFTMQLAKKGELITHHKDKAVLNFMRLKNLIEKDLKSVNINDKLGDLVKVIAKSKRNIFPVINEKNIFLGMVSLDSLRELMFNTKMYEKILVKNLLIYPKIQIKIDDNMEEVMKKFKNTNAWNLPVIDNEGKYIGFISKSKMFSVYRKLLIDISSD